MVDDATPGAIRWKTSEGRLRPIKIPGGLTGPDLEVIVGNPKEGEHGIDPEAG